LLIVCVLVGAVFMVLLERKVLGYVHIRKGPNGVGFVGLFQPFSDAIKLFTREQHFL
jgi:NADH-ubiquinone oxidoreductase chain 1